jgi:hypothetical protein
MKTRRLAKAPAKAHFSPSLRGEDPGREMRGSTKAAENAIPERLDCDVALPLIRPELVEGPAPSPRKDGEKFDVAGGFANRHRSEAMR